MSRPSLPKPAFPARLRFPDIDPATLERDDPPCRPRPLGAWPAYLARTLKPVAADPPAAAGAPALLRTREGMADFLLSLGPTPARELAGGLRAMDRSGFWDGVQHKLEALAPHA